MSTRNHAVADGNERILPVNPSAFAQGLADQTPPSNLVAVEYPIYDPFLMRKSDDVYVAVYEVGFGFSRLISVVRTTKGVTH